MVRLLILVHAPRSGIARHPPIPLSYPPTLLRYRRSQPHVLPTILRTTHLSLPQGREHRDTP
ncbi:phosphoglycerate mutase [Histoplasma capsulatum G186AR]|uniref:Phosphoglycerate mutase n=1 Tax=Ajellomyces capsulatus TaxID=5037 RepID=A0A8H7YAL6_AJECA|nr:phosphoglycerate mutase [Histoplasma capsulatum]QSS73268.1 phosphoglycerate mutase [Histoplasma capsulatum G186AR]